MILTPIYSHATTPHFASLSAAEDSELRFFDFAAGNFSAAPAQWLTELGPWNPWQKGAFKLDLPISKDNMIAGRSYVVDVFAFDLAAHRAKPDVADDFDLRLRPEALTPANLVGSFGFSWPAPKVEERYFQGSIPVQIRTLNAG